MSQPPAPMPHGRPDQGVPTCPRHPERESHVRCQRCGRPTCPECQRPAAVGVHCVDCVAEARRAVPATRTVFGGVATTGPPTVTYALIGLCVVAYLLQWTVRTFTYDGFFSPKLGELQPWRFLTAAFLHDTSQPLHILLNMLCLWQVGSLIENMLGRARFIALYFISALAGSVGYLLFAFPPQNLAEFSTSMWMTPMLGASGAVFGLFAALLLMLRRLGRSAGGLIVLLGLNALMPLIYPSIAWQAHLGGFVGGAAVVGALIATADPARRRLQWPALAAITVLLVAVAVTKYAVSDTAFVNSIAPFS